MQPVDLNGIAIRTYAPDDASAWVSLLNTIRKHPLTLEQFAERDALPTRPPIFARLVCKRDSNTVAIGQLTSSPYVPRGFARLDMVVPANYRCQGISSTLLEALELEARGQALSGLYCEQTDHDQQTLDWLAARGFVIFRKRRESQLRLEEVEAAAPDPASPTPRFRMVSLRDSSLGREQFLRFIGDRLQEAPDLEGLPPWSTEQLDAILLNNPAAPPDWIVLAMAEDQPIGVGVMQEQGPDAYIYFVGVRSQYRGALAGTAILTTLVDTARRRGCGAVNIDNVEDNMPAIRLTEKLGFRPVVTRVELRKVL